ncbi:hypothetical protein SAMN06297251_12738 [Fulvimarina manganoxydans]|uniref:Uncharacterized protein n=1 Tax=Fulvimarina manganoxydans TaxID=937218 RepID=A0A1W2EK98_9HYPH|nr:hypothetical protein SAMN06297251_12738 [Fulvimarina manganoxydans]
MLMKNVEADAPVMSKEPTCQDCRHWDVVNEDFAEGKSNQRCLQEADLPKNIRPRPAFGLCRHSPPAASRSPWPVTCMNDWCGAFDELPDEDGSTYAEA